MVLYCTGGDFGNSAIRIPRRRAGAAPVEWAAASAFRMAADHLLAGSWPSGAVPDSLRRIWTPRFRPSQFRPSHGKEDERALWKHDSRGAGELPASDARTLGLRPNHQRDKGAMKSGWPTFLLLCPTLRLQGWDFRCCSPLGIS